MYSIALGPRCFKWKMALLFLQLLIAFITRSEVNDCAISNDFLLASLVTTRVSLEEVCLPSLEVLNCWLNLVASCLDDENEIPLKVIASFSASRFALPSIPLIVLHSLVTSVFWSMVSTKCACTELLWMCVLYVSFGSKVRLRTFGCIAMGSALLFIVRSRLLVYSAGSGVTRVQVVLSEFSKRLFCFVQEKTLCRDGCMYFLAALVLVWMWL